MPEVLRAGPASMAGLRWLAAAVSNGRLGVCDGLGTADGPEPFAAS
jgi:hypothetical protein